MPSTLLELPPLAFDLTASTTAPTFGVRAGRHRIIDFLPAAAAEAYFTGFMPEARDSSDLTVTIAWVSTAVTGDAVFGVAFERHDQGVHDLDTDAFAAEKTVVSTAPALGGSTQYAEITFTAAESDAIVAGEQFRIQLRHIGTDGSRTILQNVQVTSIQIEQATSGGGGGGGGGFFSAGAGTNAAIGEGATPPTAAGANSLAQGDQSQADGANAFAQGYNNQTNFASSFVQGSGNTIAGTYGEKSFAQGQDNTVSSAHCLAQGVDINAGSATESESNVFAQGQELDVLDEGGQNAFAQGQECRNRAEAGFVQGNNVNINGGQAVFAQGAESTVDIYATGGAPYSGIRGIFLQGYNCQFTAYNEDEIRGAFVQGSDCVLYSYEYQADGSGGLGTFVQGYACISWGKSEFIQGTNCESGGFGNSGESNFAQGSDVSIDGSGNFAQGLDCSAGSTSTVTATFAQGQDCETDGNYSFAQGRSAKAHGDRSFARGRSATSYRDDQTSWGSNRIGEPNRAQFAWINKHVQTTDATPTNVITLDLVQDYAYKLEVHIIARNTTNNGENSNFVVRDALAYRDTAGAAVLSGSPVALTEVQTGTDTISARILSSGNNILVEVTGNADTYEWLVHAKWIEVRG